jgi:hypothetical protein
MFSSQSFQTLQVLVVSLLKQVVVALKPVLRASLNQGQGWYPLLLPGLHAAG